ncbi:MAG: 3'-5' exonuclease [Campylobacterota bacterium]|nr:3'-5' exonuclease [Campylobacterota bacterium]
MAYLFKLPQIADLTPEQQVALSETDPIALSGGAGTGKTVVSLWRHLQMMEDLGKYSVLVTYTKTLRFYIEKSLDSIENKDMFLKKQILPPSKQVFNLLSFPNGQWKVSEIIIDEAQDLKFDKLKEISNHAENTSYGADFNQQLYSNTVTYDEMEDYFDNNTPYSLQQNFRNTYHILNFVKNFLPQFSISQDSLNVLLNGDFDNNIDANIGRKPDLLVIKDKGIEIDKIIEIINANKSETHNISILLPFGNSGEESVENYHTLLSKKGIQCSKYYNEMRTDVTSIENIHITTFKSAKGLEFDTVIIPFFHKCKDFIARSKYTRVNEEDYYVALTRTKSNLYLLSDKNLDFIDDNIYSMQEVTVSISTNDSFKHSIPNIDIDDDTMPF